MEILELESTITEVKISLEGLNLAGRKKKKKRINEPVIDFNQSEEQKENRINKLRELKESVGHHQADQVMY